MDPWRTAIATSDPTHIWIRGHDVTALMRTATFTDTIVLLHLGRLPSPGERRLLDAILIGVADHGAGAPSCAAARLAASGNRQSLSAAIAAGILTIGDEHGGAGSTCMELIAAGLDAGCARDDRAGRGGARASWSRQRCARSAGCRGSAIVSTRRRSARRRAVRHGAGRRQVAGDGIAFMRALEAEASRADQAAPDEHRRRARRDAARHGLPAAGGHASSSSSAASPGLTAEVAEEYAREKPMRIKFHVEYDGVPPEAE